MIIIVRTIMPINDLSNSQKLLLILATFVLITVVDINVNSGVISNSLTSNFNGFSISNI